MVPADDPAADESHDDANPGSAISEFDLNTVRHNTELYLLVSCCTAIKKTCNEDGSGPVRNERCGSRTIDIGILAYGDEIIET